MSSGKRVYMKESDFTNVNCFTAEVEPSGRIANPPPSSSYRALIRGLRPTLKGEGQRVNPQQWEVDFNEKTTHAPREHKVKPSSVSTKSVCKENAMGKLVYTDHRKVDATVSNKNKKQKNVKNSF